MKINYPVSIKSITSSIEFYDEILEMQSEASEYLSGFKWCKKINNIYIYYNLGSTLSVFIYEIENSQSSNKGDNILWVIVGDIPCMYLDTYTVKTLKDALEVYTELGKDWADRIIAKKSLKACFPFDEKPSIKLAKLLNTRVEFIKNNLLQNMEDIKLED